MVTAENGIENQHLTGGIARPTFCNQRKYSITTPHGISAWFVDLEVSTSKGSISKIGSLEMGVSGWYCARLRL